MRIDVGDVRLFVDVDGAEYVPDGPAMDHAWFKSELVSLREIAQLVYIDHRGDGRSDDGPRERWNLAQWGDDVRRVCDVLGIEKPVVMGQSFGGFVAQSYAIRHPDHAAGVVFSSKRAGLRNPRGGAQAREQQAQMRSLLRAQLLDAMAPELGEAGEGDRVAVIEALVSFETWTQLRIGQGLEPHRIEAILEASVLALLDANLD